jgi:NAD+ kinase
MEWQGTLPRTFVLVHKEHDSAVLLPHLWGIVDWILFKSSEGGRSTVWLHSSLRLEVEEHEGLAPLLDKKIKFWDENVDGIGAVDLVITLGGDGTVLTAAWLFQGVVPPIVPFHFGTVGFLNVFGIEGYESKLARIITEGGRVNLRMRLHCTLRRNGILETDGDDEKGKGKHFQVMNEVVVDRGACPYMASLDIFADGYLITNVQADGLIVATPTGSTAYSLSAGGSVAHPEVPAILITPICPHTLSFRPLILPDSVELVLRVSASSRGVAWASFDGRERVELERGDAIVIQSSNYPVPTVCRDDQTGDWFKSLAGCLHWNDKPTSNHS